MAGGAAVFCLVLLLTLSKALLFVNGEVFVKSLGLAGTPYFDIKEGDRDRPQGSSLRGLIKSYHTARRATQLESRWGNCVSAGPDKLELWNEYMDDESGNYYYHNLDTDETQWENPFPECGDIDDVEVEVWTKAWLPRND